MSRTIEPTTKIVSVKNIHKFISINLDLFDHPNGYIVRTYRIDAQTEVEEYSTEGSSTSSDRKFALKNCTKKSRRIKPLAFL